MLLTPRTSTSGLLFAALLTGCIGDIDGGPARGRTEGPEGPGGGTEVVVDRVPLRALTPFELRGALVELVGEAGGEVMRLQPSRVPVGIETLSSDATGWTDTRADLLERSMYDIANRALESEGPLRECMLREGDDGCARTMLTELATRAMRRPLDAGEGERIVGAYDALAPQIGRQDALARAMQAIFLSPGFLYLTSIGRDEDDELQPHELASRLAFFLWASPPDAALLEATDAGALNQPAVLEAQARRMVSDPRASRSVARFVLGWTGALDLAAKPKRDPAWSAEMLGDALAETDHFVRDWWTQPAPSMRSLFVADHTFVTPRLAELYGLPAPASDQPTRVDGTASAHRGGLFTQASFLAAHALDDAPSSTLRGHWFLERALCQQIDGPPAAANALAPRFEEGMTLREWHEAIESNAGCSGCHMRMEPLGYAFERFDAIGRVRTEDNGQPVRTEATLRTSTELDGTYEGDRDLSEAVGESPTVRGCFARHWIAYALGRPAIRADRELEARVAAALERDAHEAVLEIVMAPAFRRARAEEE